MGLSELQAIEVAAAELVAAIVFVFVAIATGQLFLQNAKDFAASVRWRWRGLKARQRVLFDGNEARVASIGFFTTFFELQNGDQDDHYQAVSNSRLDFHSIVFVEPKGRKGPQHESP